MNNLRVCPFNFFDEAALVESPAMVTTRPATNAQLTARDKTARSTSAAAQTIKGAWGGQARRIDSFFVFRHNGQGGSVRLLLYPNADYTGTPYDSTALALATPIASDSYDWGTATDALLSAPDALLLEGGGNILLESGSRLLLENDGVNDLLLADAPYSLFFTTFTAKSFEIIFTSCARAYWDIGRIFLGKYLEAPYNPDYGMQVGWKSNDAQQRTRGASLRTRAGYRWREVKFNTSVWSDAKRALWRDFVGRIQMNKDVAISVFPGAGGRQERDFIFDAQLSELSPFTWAKLNVNETVYAFTEV